MFVPLAHRKLIGILVLMAFILTSSAFAETAKESSEQTDTSLGPVILDEITDLEKNANIAAASNGGKVIQDKSETDEDPLPRNTLVSFFDNREAVIDRVILLPLKDYTSVYPREVELWSSPNEAGEDFEQIGRYLLKPETLYHSIAFAPVKAKRFRVSVVEVHPHYDYTRVVFDKVMVLESEGNGSILDGAVAEVFKELTEDEQNADIAAAINGGKVIQDKSETDEDPLPRNTLVSFFDNREAVIDRVILLPLKDYTSVYPREVELWSSPNEAGEDFEQIGRYLLKPETLYHSIAFAPVKAKRFRVSVVEVHPHYDYTRVVFDKVMVLESEGNGSILDGAVAEVFKELTEDEQNADIAAAINGGKVIQDKSETDEDPLPRNTLVSFFDNREAVIDRVILLPLKDYTSVYPREVELWSSPNEAGEDFEQIGRYLLKPETLYHSIAFAPVKAKRFRVSVVEVHPHYDYTRVVFDKVMVLESEGNGSILDGSVAEMFKEVSDAEQDVNIAAAFNGGRVIQDKSETGQEPLPRNTLVTFFENHEAIIDRVILLPVNNYTTVYPREVELWSSPNEAGEDFEQIGRYLLKPETLYHSITFAPVKAKRFRVSVVEVHPHYDYTRVVFEKIMVLEAQKPGYDTMLEKVRAVPLEESSLQPRMNIALSILGGRIESASSQRDDEWSAENLIDRTVVDSNGWLTSKEQEWPQNVVFSLRDHKIALIDSVILDSRVAEQYLNGTMINVFEIQVSVSDTPEDQTFSTIGRYFLRPEVDEQVVRFDPIEARFVRLLIHSSMGKNQLSVLGEFKILEAPSQDRTSIIAGLDINIADYLLGGHIARYTSQDNSTSFMIDGRADGEAPCWTSKDRGEHKATDTQDLVFGFRDSREALIEKIVIEPPFSGTDKNVPAELKVLVSNDNVLDGFHEVELDRTQPLKVGIDEWPLTITLKNPSTVRFVMLRLISNHGGDHFAMGDVRIIEDREAGNVSIIAEGKQVEEASGDSDTKKNYESDSSTVYEQEPNNVREQATMLTIDEAIAGRISSTDIDYFVLESKGKTSDDLIVNFEATPYIKATIDMESKKGETVENFMPTNSTSREKPFYLMSPTGKYYFKLTGLLPRIALVYDNSGSMDGNRMQLKKALKEYVRDLSDDEEVLLFGFGSKVEHIKLNTVDAGDIGSWQKVTTEYAGSKVNEEGNKVKIDAVGDDVRKGCLDKDISERACILSHLIDLSVRDTGGTSLFDAIIAAAEVLGQAGNRAILLMTDGQDSASGSWPPEVWDVLRDNRVRIYTIGLGNTLQKFFVENTKDIGSSGESFLRNVAMATGGEYHFTASADDLTELYRNINIDFLQDTHYRLTATFGKPDLEAEIVKPTKEDVVKGETEIEVSVHTDPSFPVEKVEFYADGELLQNMTETPWELKWDAGEENRSHEVRIIAYNNAGMSIEDTVITKKPRGKTKIVVEGAGDDKLPVEKVEIYSGGKLIKTLTQPPWETLLDAWSETSDHEVRVIVHKQTGPSTGTLLVTSVEGVVHTTGPVSDESRSAATPATRSVLFILDASSSMRDSIEGRPKMDIARDVLAQVIKGLPDGMMVGLRVYGHRFAGPPGPITCTDSELKIPIGPLDKQKFVDILNTIKPTGNTPLVYSLLQAKGDFREVTTGERRVVLVSDGYDSCGGDPSEIKESMMTKGLPFVYVDVVGFALGNENDKEKLRNIAQSTGGIYVDAEGDLLPKN